MGHKRFSFICFLFVCIEGLCLYSAQRAGLYDYDVLIANPELIQPEPWRESASSRPSVEKDDVKGLYDFDSGGRIYTESRTEASVDTKPATSRSMRKNSKSGVKIQDFDDSKSASQSFSDVSEQIRTSKTQEKTKKTPATARAFQAQETRLFDFEDNPEYPDLTTVVTDNVKPAISPE